MSSTDKESRIRTVWLDETRWREASGLLIPEAVNALEKGLPMVALCAVMENKVIGAIAGAANKSEFQIVSLFVHPEYRRLGAGRAMMEELYSSLADTGLLLTVNYSGFNPESDTLRPFLGRVGFREADDFYPAYFITSVQDLKTEDITYEGDPLKVLHLGDMDESFFSCGEHKGAEGLVLPERSFKARDIDRRSSLIALKDDIIEACVIVRGIEDEMIRIDADGARGLMSDEVIALTALTIKMLKEKYTEDTAVCMLSSSPLSEAFIRRISEGSSRISHRFTNFFPGVI